MQQKQVIPLFSEAKRNNLPHIHISSIIFTPETKNREVASFRLDGQIVKLNVKL